MQEPQRALSDAYLSGMSTKRRKLLSANKPEAANANNVLGQGIRNLLQTRAGARIAAAASTSASGGGSASAAATVAALDEAIASNPHIQEPHGSYEQALLSHVQNRIRTDNDYSPDRFPNVTKWVQKNQ